MLRNLSLILSGCSKHRVVPLALQSSSIRFLHSSCVGRLCSGNIDIPCPNLPTPAERLHAQDTDILLEQIRKARTPQTLMQLVSMHLDIMNNKHVVSSFDVLYAYVIEQRDEVIRHESSFDLTNDSTFQALCSRILKRARFLEPSEIINIFKVLCILGIKNNTYIMQAMLKMICSQVNELTLSELSFLNFLLSKQKSNPAVDGLKMALPLVLQVKIEQHLDSSSTNEVVSCLKVCCKSRLKMSTIEKIIEALLRRTLPFTSEQAVTVVISLLHLQLPVDGYLDLLNKAFHFVTHNIDTFENGKILHIVRLCDKNNFFHKDFFIKTVKKAISSSWSLSEVGELQKYLFKLGFYSDDLLIYLCNEVLSNTHLVGKENKLSPFTLAKHYAFTDCKPANIEQFLDILCDSNEHLELMYATRPDSCVHFVSFLSMIGYFHPKIYDKVLSENFLSRAWSNGRRYGRALQFERSICSIQWFLDIEVQGVQVPASIFEQVFQSMRNRVANSYEYPLTKYIENGLGGPQFLRTNMLTRNGHIVDHVLAMRNGDFPICLNSSNKKSVEANFLPSLNYIEDLPVPHDAKIVPIIVAKEENYWKDPAVLHGWMKLKIRHLSHMGFFPVVVNIMNWQRLPDREKIPYVMYEVRKVMKNDIFSKSNVS